LETGNPCQDVKTSDSYFDKSCSLGGEDLNWHLDVKSIEEREEIVNAVKRLGPWYHSFDLADWLKIEAIHDGDSVLACLDRLGFPRDFSDKTVLDVGCSAGYYSFVARSRGARRVVGVELDPHYVQQARYLSNLLRLDVDFMNGDAHQIDASLGMFDIVICTGLMYHIQDPTNVLSRLSAVCTDTLLVESEFLLDPALSSMARFIEGTYMDDPTNWWIYGPQCLEGMVRAAGFQSAEFKGFYREPHGEHSPEGIPKGGRGFLIGKKHG
jgi:tRNA (mo5U34)-methyltransferase